MEKIIEYYDKLAKDYDNDRFNNSYGKFIDTQERVILNELLTDKNEKIIDLACGTGRLLNYVNYGIDASAEMVKISKLKFPNKTIFHANAENIPLNDKSINTIISFHFFMHLDLEKIEIILNECNRILKDGGRIIFDIPSAKRRKLLNFKSKNWHGRTSLTIEEINRINNNFEVKRVYGFLFIPVHRLPKSLRNLFLKLDRKLSNSFLKEFSSYQIIELVKK